MHITQFIEEDQRRNPTPKHWWQQKSPWYERILMIATAIFGASLVLYMLQGYITMPVDIKDQAGMPGITIIIAFIVFGLVLINIGVKGIIHTFRRAMGISHGEAILACIIVALLITPFSAALRIEMDKGLKLTMETQMLQAKIKTLEATH